ncbi:cysteine desulfurase family protein [Oceanivirga salmonicida]|uniref:cysteine desulfurase family protein n=1 Tax=Oceanivirga salmonicida TaxID=1769291 RepID=UPI0012E10A04|nr:cysteine desulfurase family protein [Oceanivirga salmonicida]
MKNIYLDNAASTKFREELLDELVELNKNIYANPSSVHSLGRQSRVLLENARLTVAKNLGVDAKNIIFTSGATESNNMAINSAINKQKEILCSSIEHSSILEHMKQLETMGYIVKYINVKSDGMIDLEHFRSLMSDKVGLVVVMAVNNETGSIQAIKEIAKEIKNKNIHFHVDAAQYITKEKMNIYEMGADSMSFSAHKFYGPKGVGILYIKDDIAIKKLIYGGKQERNKRAGTENLLNIILSSKALEIAINNMEKEKAYVKGLMDYFVSNIQEMENIQINGENRISNIINISIKDKNIQLLLPMLDLKGICVSGGSACMSGSLSGSHVLKAMGFDDDRVMSSIRISLGIYNTKEEIDYLITTLKEI